MEQFNLNGAGTSGTAFEKQLCREIRLSPHHYLRMQEVLTVQIYSGNITRKSDAYPLFQIEATKVDRVYDMLLKKGVAPL
ncbi:hypothetical protein MTR67_024846 [Solanum verrucosum]|uniref:SWIRM domain-containing protein n=1 Tax=Solanum verrucosum TaxID=315347 RepID=A0AAF0TT21_SOLVR|nr:hypothetical protein MTR67_024846 [Solanum verrucosum]